MTHPLHALRSSSLLSRRVLPGAEWLADNAFIPPGTHRLLTAGGLALGLWAGRALMDVVTARHGDEELAADKVPELLRPICGLMRYNPYSDKPADRWKFVIDRSMPMLSGALGAWAGSRHYGYGKDPSGKPFFQAGTTTRAKYDAGDISMQVADSNARRMQADALRVPASIGFAGGSATGTQLFGALFPFNNGGMSGLSFQSLAERMVNIPGMGWFNRTIAGNRTNNSRSLRPAMADAAMWARNNLLKFGDPQHWLTDTALANRTKEALQNFEHVTPEQEKKIGESIRGLITDAHHYLQGLGDNPKASELLFDRLQGTPETVGFGHKAFDRFLHTNGMDLTKASIGESGKFSFLARFFGSTKAERVLETKWSDYLKDTFGLDYGASRLTLKPQQVAATWGAAAAGVGTVLAVGGIAGDRMNNRLGRTTVNRMNAADGVVPVSNSTLQRTAENEAKRRAHKPHNLVEWLNDKPLDVAQWVSRVFINPPSMHRFMNAAYLSGALWLGMETANALTGRKLPLLRSSNSILPRDQTFFALKPLHGLLSYTPGSVALQDRWRQAAHYMIPVALGAVGTFTGSHMFFKDRIKKLEKPESLEEFADKIGMEQSKFYAGITAVTSIFNTGSGVHLLPFFNYSSNLHNRYLMASGQQVAMPGIGKWWSGNPGLTPWGVKRGLSYMVKYTSYNSSARPTELSSLMHSVVAKLYPHMPEDMLLAKKQAVLDQLHEVRDTYLVDGVIPEAKQPALHDAMKKLLSGEGFEKLLLQSGLNPAEANLASNGASGAISNVMGNGGKVKALEASYREKFAERLATDKVGPREYLGKLCDQTAAKTPVANDNIPSANDQTPVRSFAERVKESVQPAAQSAL